MSFVEREVDRIRAILIAGGSEREAEYYAAQQALCWALEPTGVASPYEMITGTRGGSEGCLAAPDPHP